jgi:hypothetical protein
MLNKFNNNFPKKPFHSHGFAHAANSDGIGAASPETFTQRQQTHHNRQLVRGYGDSLLANGQHREMGLQADVAAAQAPAQPDNRAVTHLDRRGFSVGIGVRKPQQRSIDSTRSTAPAPRKPNFTEPRHRYNPYQ